MTISLHACSGHEADTQFDVFDQDLESFAQVLYNGETGNLKQAFVDGDRKGTGVFGKELNIGSFAMLSDDQVYKGDDFCIEPEFRGKGIGSWALQKLLQHKSIQVSILYTTKEVSL